MYSTVRKVMRILLLIGVIVYLQYDGIQHSIFISNSTVESIYFASLVYLLAVIFCGILCATSKYLLAIAGTGILTYLAFFKLDMLVEILPWLTNELLMFTVAICAMLFCLRDIFGIKNYFTGSVAAKDNSDSSLGNSRETQQFCKKSPEMMMEFSRHYELIKGYKPTYEELVDYIDNEAFK